MRMSHFSLVWMTGNEHLFCAEFICFDDHKPEKWSLCVLQKRLKVAVCLRHKDNLPFDTVKLHMIEL